MPDKVQTNIPVIDIKVGTAAVTDAESELEEVVIDTTYNLPAMATIRLIDPKMKWIKGDVFAIGKKLSLTLGAPKSTGGTEPAEVFVGEIVALEPHFSSQGTHTLTVRAYDRSHRMHLGTKSRTFVDMTDSDIVKKVAEDSKLDVEATATTIKYEYVVQNNQTDMEFLIERARRVGFHLCVIADKLHFFSPKNPPAGPILELGEGLRDLSVRMSAARQAENFAARGWDFRKKEAILGESPAVKLWHDNGQSKSGGEVSGSVFPKSQLDIVNHVPRTVDEAKQLAAAAATDQEGQFFEASGVAWGHPKLVAGVEVELKGLGPTFSGKYFVTSAAHVYNEGGYDVHFTVSGRYPQSFNQLLRSTQDGSNQRGLMEGVVIGVVTSLKDPENHGRVQVKFPWIMDVKKGIPIGSNWARIAAPSAGKERGFYFLPEVEDEVLVAFEHGDPNSPFIVGALWNGKDAPPETNAAAHVNGKTIHRILASRLGHRFVFDDSDDKKSILIEDTTKTQSIFIDSTKKSITIKAAGDMLIDVTGNIDIKSGANITIEAKGNIKASGINVDVNASGNANVEATSALGLKGTASAKLESPATTTVAGTTKVDINSGMNVKVMAPMIDLN
jgi:uncharacterized protein involved in type VI secretion and phage assembly